jgi:hypothetical protein
MDERAGRQTNERKYRCLAKPKAADFSSRTSPRTLAASNAAIESARGANRDVILDFSHAQGDIVDLSGLDADIKKTNVRSLNSLALSRSTTQLGNCIS